TKHNLALIYDSTNKWGKSDVLYMELIASDSTDAQAYNNYAYSLVERGEDMEFALELSKNSIRLSPKSAPYLDTLGWIYFKMDRIDEAIKVIKESLSIDNGNPTIQAHLEEIIKAKSNPEISKVIQAEIKD
ncbi:MAG: tetratricopeptide repeat protein, partial [Fidelibacterota bacterium]